jgi:DNA repair protein RadC
VVFALALKTGASAIILSHNHPSGSTQPSYQDIDITKRVYEAGKLLGLPLLDHIIIGDSYRSMNDEDDF